MSLLCALTFLVAHHLQTYDYRSFFKQLLGPGWPLFELAYILFVVLILAVYGAAAGEIGRAVFGSTGVARHGCSHGVDCHCRGFRK